MEQGFSGPVVDFLLCFELAKVRSGFFVVEPGMMPVVPNSTYLGLNLLGLSCSPPLCWVKPPNPWQFSIFSKTQRGKKLIHVKGTQARYSICILSHLSEPSSEVDIIIINFCKEVNEAQEG